MVTIECRWYFRIFKDFNKYFNGLQEIIQDCKISYCIIKDFNWYHKIKKVQMTSMDYNGPCGIVSYKGFYTEMHLSFLSISRFVAALFPNDNLSIGISRTDDLTKKVPIGQQGSHKKTALPENWSNWQNRQLLTHKKERTWYARFLEFVTSIVFRCWDFS